MKTEKTTHTPGPWTIHTTTFCGDGPLIIEATNPANGSRFNIARVTPLPGASRDGQKWANARLIAAAPQLLDALKAVLKLNENMNGKCLENDPAYYEFCAARAAIAKAEGQ